MNDITILAHRGISNNSFEDNTLEAFCRVKEINSKFKLGLEFDVQITLDNELILFHDSNLEDIVVERSLYSSILDKKSNIQRLEDLFKEFHNTDYILNIELKYYNDNNSRVKTFSNILLKIINKYNIKYIISSYKKELINELKNKKIENCFYISENLKDKSTDITKFDLYQFYNNVKGVYTLYDGENFDESVINDIIKSNIIYLITDNVEKLNSYLNRILI